MAKENGRGEEAVAAANVTIKATKFPMPYGKHTFFSCFSI